MCRAEAHSLFAKKKAFDSLGIQLYAVLHENIESEVCLFSVMTIFSNNVRATKDKSV